MSKVILSSFVDEINIAEMIVCDTSGIEITEKYDMVMRELKQKVEYNDNVEYFGWDRFEKSASSINYKNIRGRNKEVYYTSHNRGITYKYLYNSDNFGYKNLYQCKIIENLVRTYVTLHSISYNYTLA